MDAAELHNVTVSGPEDGRPLVFAHGRQYRRFR